MTSKPEASNLCMHNLILLCWCCFWNTVINVAPGSSLQLANYVFVTEKTEKHTHRRSSKQPSTYAVLGNVMRRSSEVRVDSYGGNGTSKCIRSHLLVNISRCKLFISRI